MPRVVASQALRREAGAQMKARTSTAAKSPPAAESDAGGSSSRHGFQRWAASIHCQRQLDLAVQIQRRASPAKPTQSVGAEEVKSLNDVQASQFMVNELMNQLRELHGDSVEIPDPYITYFKVKSNIVQGD